MEGQRAFNMLWIQNCITCLLPLFLIPYLNGFAAIRELDIRNKRVTGWQTRDRWIAVTISKLGNVCVY